MEAKKKSGGEKEKKKEGGNDSFKSKEFISSEESSSESDHDRGSKRKVCNSCFFSTIHRLCLDLRCLSSIICLRLLMMRRRKRKRPLLQQAQRKSRDLTDVPLSHQRHFHISGFTHQSLMDQDFPPLCRCYSFYIQTENLEIDG